MILLHTHAASSGGAGLVQHIRLAHHVGITSLRIDPGNKSFVGPPPDLMASQQVLTLPRGANTAACNGLTLPADPLPHATGDHSQ